MAAKIDPLTGKISITGEGLYGMNFPDLLTYVAQKSNYILVGDRHDVPQIALIFLDPANVKRMQVLGVTDVGLEIDRKYQFVVNEYYSGKRSFESMKSFLAQGEVPWLTAEQFATYATRLSEFIKESKEAKIAVHFMDKDPSDYPIAKQQPELMKLFWKLLSASPAEEKAYLAELEKTNKGITAAHAKFSETYLAQRHQYNAEIAQNMKAMRQKKGGKVALFFGRDHFAGERDINEFLGKEAAVIAISPILTEKLNAGFSVQDLPNYLYIIQAMVSDGVAVPAAGKISPNNERTEECKKLITGRNGLYALAACAVKDVDFGNFSDNPVLTPMPKMKKAAQAVKAS